MNLTNFIEECRARLKDITPGKWVPAANHDRLFVHSGAIPICMSNYAHEPRNRNDFNLIANAPTDIAKLLAIVECLYNSIAEAPHGRTCSIYDGHPCDCVRKSLREVEEIVSSKT